MINPTTRKLQYPVVQSPMAGCSDLAFRLVARRRGMEYGFLEMISANGLMFKGRNTLNLLKTHPDDAPIGVQLIGEDPDVMGVAAETLEARGFSHIDINMGCPVRKMVSQGAGAALLRSPKKVEKILKKVIKMVQKIPVTVKIRKGCNDDSGRQAVEIAKISENCGLAAITVHGRTKEQGYAGSADWDVIGEVKRSVKIPVLGNGDVFSADDARRLMTHTGCDGVMIGRGGLGNPWLSAEILSTLFGRESFQKPTIEDRKKAVLEHFSLEVMFGGEKRAILHFRRIGAWYFQGFPNARLWRGELNQCHTKDDVSHVLDKCFSGREPQYA